MRTVSRLASYWSSLVREKRSVNEPLAAEGLHDPHALEALLQRREVGRDAVAHFEVRLVRDAAEPTAREEHRRHDDRARRARAATTCNRMTITAPTNRKMFCTNSTRPCEISSCSASMSEVMRATMRPVFSRSKKSSDERHQVVEQALAQRAEERLADPGDEQDREPAEEQPGERHARGTARPRG